MGFDPYRKQRASVGDVVLIISALIVTTALVAWAFLA